MLIKPLISEKTMGLVGGSMYTFLVSLESTKQQIKREITERFKVDVLAVSMVTIKGKRKMQRSRKGYYLMADKKKAIIQLKKGQTIGLFENALKGEEDVKVTTGDGEAQVVKEKKSLLKGTKVKVEKETARGEVNSDQDKAVDSKKQTPQLAGKSKGGKQTH